MAISQTNPFGQVVQVGARGRFVENAPSATRATGGVRRSENPAVPTAASSAPAPQRTTEESRVSEAQDVEKVTGSPRLKTSKALVDFHT